MAKFKPNEPVETRGPFVKVENLLKPGTYRFQLVVVDDQGKRSPAVEKVVKIVRTGPP